MSGLEEESRQKETGPSGRSDAGEREQDEPVPPGREPEKAEPDGAADESGEQRRTVVVGLVSDPGLPAEYLGSFVDELADDLSRRVSDEVDWEVRSRTQPLELDEGANVPIVRLARQALPEYGWDVVIFVTDLPRRLGTTPVVADMSSDHRAALASLPALGGIRVCRRLQDTLLYLIGALSQKRGFIDGAEGMRGRAAGRLAPVRWTDNPVEGIESAVVLTGWRGRARLLFGMVRDNKPWRLVPELSTALAAGFAAAAFGIFYSSIWSLADALGPMRLVTVNVLAIVAMVAWLIFYNNLWQPRSELKEKAWLYNLATVVTLSLGVLSAYVVLFLVTLGGALAVIPPDYLGQTLGHSAGPGSYLSLVWLSATMGTFAGALGSSLESEQAVNRATYSKRERQRRQRFEELREREDERERREDRSGRGEERDSWDEI
ncbi:hypothetical protein [Saccharomonospora saliphila]|uniref:hypothetical protein n=1 Tax=Saccharomonospora saliphila TaxID=369829 RepID=UPI00037D24AD|nr:hypothetical protein [Saccharomonospora saliphila]